MKLTKISNLILMGSALAFTVVGCKKHPTPLTNLPNGARTGMKSPPGLEPMPFSPPIDSTAGITSSQTPSNIAFTGTGHEHDGWAADPAALASETVYFEFDKSSIKSSEQSKVEAVAAYLKSNPAAAVRVEGNCDERGTEEYNRSLGERRALAAREALARLGIDPSRVDTTTFGEDKPCVTGHDESAYSKNRRDEFVVLTPPK